MSLLDAVLKTHWAITPDAFQQIVNFVMRDYSPMELAKVMHGDYQKFISILESNGPEALLKQDDEDLPNSYRSSFRQNVAIIPVTGPIFPRSNLMTLSGATSVTTIAKDLHTALNNDAIDTIIMNFDTPGGEVTGVSELAQMIYAIRSRTDKKVLSYVYGLGASAGYWLLSPASEVWAADTAQVGSIGVVAGYIDRSKADEKAGVSRVEVVSSVSPMKRVNPNTDEGRAQIQKMVDDLASIFVGAVAKYRKTTDFKVLSDFGKGGVVLAQEALDKGMIDKVGSLEEMIDKNIKSNTFLGGFMPISVAQVKADSPETYNAILEEGKKLAGADTDAKVKTAKDEGYAAGVKAERDRVQGIDSLKVPGAEAIIAAHKYDEGMTRDKMAALILDEQEKVRAAAANKHKVDAQKLGEVSKEISKESNDNPEAAEERAVVANIIAGAQRNK